MRILHVVPYYEDAWAYGGIPRVAAALARGLTRRGHDVTVCTTDAADASTRAVVRDDYEGVTVYIFRNRSNRLAYRWQFFTPIGLSAFLRDRAAGFDVAHLHACHNLPGVQAARALTRAGVPYVVSPNGTALRIERRRLAKLAFDLAAGRRVLRDASRVLAVTSAERDRLSAAGIHGTRLTVLPNPIDERQYAAPPDAASFRRQHGLDGDPLVLYLGQLTPRKGVDVLVRAFARVRADGARLFVAGNDGGTGRTIDTLARASQLGRRYMRVGVLRGAERLAALAAADVVAYPSRDEAFGLVPVEALACGTPVVVSSDHGCGEVITELGGGLAVPYDDETRLADAIDGILAEPQSWRLRAATAGAQALARFGADTVCGRLESIYGDVMRSAA